MSDKPLSDFQVGDRVRITTIYNDSPFDVIAPGFEMTILSVRHGGSVLLDRDHSTYSVDGRLYRAELITPVSDQSDPIAKLIEYAKEQAARAIFIIENEASGSLDWCKARGARFAYSDMLKRLEAIAAEVRS